MMTRLLVAGALAGILVGGAAFGQTSADSSPRDVPAQSSVKLAKVFIDMPAGTPWVSVKIDTLFCLSDEVTKAWPGGRFAEALAPYSAAFKTELEHAGYKVVTPGEDNVFDPEAGSADYEAAAVITNIHIDGCANDGSYFTDRGSVRGTADMTVDWQVYSPIKRQLVAHLTTTGTAKLEKSVQGGLQQLMMGSFDDNARALAASADLRAALSAPKAFTAGFQVPGQQSPITLSGSSKAGPRKIADAVGSIVTILTGTGSGSAILVSDDGYMLTNAHVVGDDKTVRVRWSDGLEGLAQIVRVSKNRDVALIKTNPRDRTPLALKRGAVTPGQRVYAVGSPNGKDFQGTVSSGVISADRVIDGLRYIQSDVSISPGSSGGALLDENGSVIGITVAFYLNEGRPAGLNMFIPIGDAMDFLSLKQTDQAQADPPAPPPVQARH